MTCVWEPDTACLGDRWENRDEGTKARALALATSSLITLTYGRVGTCPITVRPCLSTPCGCGEWDPHRTDSQWYVCGSCSKRCAPAFEIDLDGPVGYIESIKVDGDFLALDNGDWRIDNGHLLVWQGSGPSPIPTSQNLSKPDTEVGTWSITYSQSHAVPNDGRIAVALLAEEFAKACSKSGSCGLPKGVTSVVRNGVTFSIEAGLFPGGLTGIEIVDQFILKWAPAGAPTRTASVFNPRRAAMRRTAKVQTQSTGAGFGQGGFGL